MTPEYLNECFTWDYEGNLNWKERPRSHFKSDGDHKSFNTRFANKPAGTAVNRNGYHVVGLCNKDFRVHRILYMLYHNTTIPDGLQVDHEDENKRNNTFKNLRLGTCRQNNCNQSKQKNNTSGYKGVYLDKTNKFRAQISINSIYMYLGNFNTAEEAHEAYKAASMKYHGEFSNFG